MIVSISWFVACVVVIYSMIAPALFYNYGVFGDQGWNIAYAFILAVVFCYRLIKNSLANR